MIHTASTCMSTALMWRRRSSRRRCSTSSTRRSNTWVRLLYEFFPFVCLFVVYSKSQCLFHRESLFIGWRWISAGCFLHGFTWKHWGCLWNQSSGQSKWFPLKCGIWFVCFVSRLTSCVLLGMEYPWATKLLCCTPTRSVRKSWKRNSPHCLYTWSPLLPPARHM